MDRQAGPLLVLCGLVCFWPLLWAMIGMYIGRRGMPFRVVRGGGYPMPTQLRGRVAMRNRTEE